MDQINDLGDGRFVAFNFAFNASDERVPHVAVYDADGTALTSAPVEFAAGTPVGVPFSQDYQIFYALPDAGGGLRVVAPGPFAGDTYVFTLDSRFAVTGNEAIDTAPNDATVRFLGVWAADYLPLSNGDIASASGQNLLLSDATGLFQSSTPRPGPFESTRGHDLVETAAGQIFRVSMVSVPDGLEVRGQFYGLDGSLSGAEILIASGITTSGVSFGALDVHAVELTDGRIAVAYVAQRAGDEDDSNASVLMTVLNADGTVAVPEFLVNTGDTRFDQDNISLFALASGGLAVAYDGSETSVRFYDDTITEIRAFNSALNPDYAHVTPQGHVYQLDPFNTQLLFELPDPDAPGIPGEEFFLSQAFSGELAEDAETATLTDGRVVVVYDHTNLEGYIRIYDPADGSVTDVGTTPRFSHNMTTIGLADGGFAVAWVAGGGIGDILLRVYNADGTLRADTQTVLDGEGEHLRAVPTATGFALAWVDDTGTLDDDEQLQFFNAQGVALGAPIDYHPGRDVEIDADSALLSNGNTVLTWSASNSGYFAIYDAAGTEITSGPQLIATTTGLSSRQPTRVAALPDGGFVTVHVDSTGTFYRSTFDAAGNVDVLADPLPKDPDLPANTDGWRLEQVWDIAITGEGQLVVAYQIGLGGTNENDVRFSIFDPDGATILLHQTANVNLPDDQTELWLTELDNGRVLLSFSDDTNIRFGPQQAIRGVQIQGGEVPPADPITDGGGPGSDTITGDTGNDTLSGGGGSDSILASSGDDLINGGIGFDTVDAGAGDDTVVGGDGYDSIEGGAGNDEITGNNGFDTLLGGAGSDTLSGGLGTDLLNGGADADFLQGQSGGDTLLGGDGDDTLNGNAGADDLAGEAGDDVLNGGINHDTLAGGAGNDTLNAGNGADTLLGGDGDDRLEGNGGSDTLDGGAGNDVLRGGIGADVFVFELGSGQDRIVDLSLVDTLRLDADLFAEAAPVANDIRAYASLNADGFVVLTFGSDSLTFTGITNATPVVNAIEIF